jgi:hypothetical protein
MSALSSIEGERKQGPRLHQRFVATFADVPGSTALPLFGLALAVGARACPALPGHGAALPGVLQGRLTGQRGPRVRNSPAGVGQGADAAETWIFLI